MTRAHARPVSALAIRAPRIPRHDGVKSSHSRCSFAEVRTDYLARTGARTARRSESSQTRHPPSQAATLALGRIRNRATARAQQDSTPGSQCRMSSSDWRAAWAANGRVPELARYSTLGDAESLLLVVRTSSPLDDDRDFRIDLFRRLLANGSSRTQQTDWSRSAFPVRLLPCTRRGSEPRAEQGDCIDDRAAAREPSAGCCASSLRARFGPVDLDRPCTLCADKRGRAEGRARRWRRVPLDEAPREQG